MKDSRVFDVSRRLRQSVDCRAKKSSNFNFRSGNRAKVREPKVQDLESKPVIVGKNLMFWCKVLRVLRQEDLLTLNQNTKTYGIDVK